MYGSASLMAWLNLESELTPALELQRRFGELRQQMRSRAPALAGSSLALLGAGVLAVLSFAGPQSTERSRELFEIPQAEDQQGPLLVLADRMIGRRERAASRIFEAPSPSETITDEPSQRPSEPPERSADRHPSPPLRSPRVAPHGAGRNRYSPKPGMPGTSSASCGRSTS